jgi:hypothetical protein
MACSTVTLIAPVCRRSMMVTVALTSLINGWMPWSSLARRSCRWDRAHAVSHPAWLSWFRWRAIMILEKAEPSVLLTKQGELPRCGAGCRRSRRHGRLSG